MTKKKKSTKKTTKTTIKSRYFSDQFSAQPGEGTNVNIFFDGKLIGKAFRPMNVHMDHHVNRVKKLVADVNNGFKLDARYSISEEGDNVHKARILFTEGRVTTLYLDIDKLEPEMSAFIGKAFGQVQQRSKRFKVIVTREFTGITAETEQDAITSVQVIAASTTDNSARYIAVEE